MLLACPPLNLPSALTQPPAFGGQKAMGAPLVRTMRMPSEKPQSPQPRNVTLLSASQVSRMMLRIPAALLGEVLTGVASKQT